jgi:TolB-like protein/DNA-binding winged helix-turn-helix (wHTH) protein/Flp pilus assembly protein TadD
VPEATPSPTLVRFGAFEVDLRSGELRKQGLKVRLQERPFQILTFLLENRGEVVTREELRKRLWPEDTFVDFDHSVNTAINKLRDALGDTAENPRFVETLPRHGYRFIGPVDYGSVAGNHGNGAELPARRGKRRWLAPFAIFIVAVILLFETLVALNVTGLRDWLLGSIGHPKIESIAVLPFENLSGNPGQEYFADGMTEELITDLGKISALHVISRTSVMRYKGTTKPLPEVARELHVDALVEGTVRRSGNRVRITANLLYAPADRHLWAQAFESNRRDVLALQSEIARTIASHIKIKLTPQEHVRLASARPINPEAHEAYLMGRHQWNRRTEESLNRSITYFREAIEKDPGYASAYAGLADAYAILGDNGFRRPKDVFPLARAAAVRALELDANLAEAHTSLGSVKKAYDWDWTGAEKELRRAIELNPNYATARQFYGELLESEGRFPAAIAELRRACQLDPFAPRIQAILVWTLYLARRYDEGLEEVEKGIQVDPYSATFFFDRGEIYLQKRMYERALADLRKADGLLPGPYYPHLGLVRGYAVSGRRREALKELAELNDVSKRRYVMASLVAVAYSELGDKQQAFAWLETAYEQRDPWLALTLKSEPGFDSLRSDPRFQDILRRMNFPP